MFSTKLLAGMAALAMAVPGVSSAQSTYNFSYTAQNGNVLGTGTFTTGAANPAGSFFTPSALITNLTGTYRGADITGLLTAGTYFANDNIFYTSPPAGSGNLDLRGVAFSTTAGMADFYFGLGGYGTIFTRTGGTATSNVGGTFAVTPAVAAVPEPATWAMMLIGFGVVGQSLRRRQTVSTRIRYV
ncbi:PEP-CTERM sorting domain-containing protein [Sphingomonas panacisoli]|uniref:PEP-CTERM sorting domain-containing protein n=1 Tax=Sphingomonas panacisoli TaxID=1813879 RepID=A0A5B8LP57_9SPHN|nr:PEPxxWA-CTERM sorting domain-containing protein [Sphingomonas panacisoli]QDZ09182.1 PEP-CTERM sorting domain-containing protein [Sphingomonas panacisoli]